MFVMNANGSNARAIVTRSGNEYDPTWSPDGRFIACTVQRRNMRRLELVEVDGNSQWLLPSESTNLRSIRFSPDGSKIAAAFSLYGSSGIKLYDISSHVGLSEPGDSTVKNLVEFASLKPRSQLWYSTGSASPRLVARTFTGVSFSPDGSSLVYCSDHPPANQEREDSAENFFQLFTLSLDGKEPPAPISGTGMPWPVQTDWARR